MAAELKSLIEEFRKFDKNSVIKAFQAEDKENNLKLCDKIFENLNKIHDHWNGIEKVQEYDLRGIVDKLNILKYLRNSPPSILSNIFLKGVENLSSKIVLEISAEYVTSVVIGEKTFGKRERYRLMYLNNLHLDVVRLAPFPQHILSSAGEKLQSCSDPVQSAFLRRIIQNAMVGGISPQLLNLAKDFKFCSKNLDSCSLPLDSNSLDYEIKSMHLIDEHFKNFRNYYPCKYSSESRLRVLLWDNLINILVTEAKDKAWPINIVPELNVAPLLGLGKEVRRVDLVLLSTDFDMPCFFVEYALEESEGSFGHKDYTKISSMMTIGCNKLCEKLQKLGSDPSIVKIFGMLVGRTKVQLLVAHPVIKNSSDGHYSEIHIVVTSHGHWHMNLIKGKGLSLNCQNSKCCRSPPHTVTLHPPEIQTDLKAMPHEHLKKIKLDSDSESESSSSDSGSSSSEDELQDKDEIYIPVNSVNMPIDKELNMNSLKKIDSFIKCAKGFIEQLSEGNLKLNPNKLKPIKFPNVAHVPQSLPSNFGFAPDPRKVMSVEKSILEGLRNALFKEVNFHKAKRKISFEYQLYTERFRNSRLFPEMLSCDLNHESKTVTYTFEKMTEFLGGGSLGLLKENRNFFGPKIRDQHPCYVILEAATFALHALYGLEILHEEFGVVHGDISPRNIMFSEIDDIWKLNDFETTMKLEDSLKIKRSIGTSGYICPLSQETGIYDKSSDIYSLGKVLWSTFVMKLICEIDVLFDDLPEGTREAVDEFMGIVRDMIQAASIERPSAKRLIPRFYSLLKDNLLEDFYIYGSKLLIPRIEKLALQDFKVTIENDDDILFKKICMNE